MPDTQNSFYCRDCSAPAAIVDGKCAQCKGTRWEETVSVAPENNATPPPASNENSESSNTDGGEKKKSWLDSIFDSGKKLFESFTEAIDSLTDESIFDEWFGDTKPVEDEALKNSVYGGAYGVFDSGSDNARDVDTHLENLYNNTSGNLQDDDFSQNILGLPLYFNKTADPHRRTYNDTIIYDNPVMYILPGKPKLNNKMLTWDGELFNISTGEYADVVDGDVGNADSGFGYGIFSPRNGDDMRYVSFKSDFHQYWKYVQVLGSHVHSYLNAIDGSAFNVYDFGDEFKNRNDAYGLGFYADKSTTISESADNSYSASRISEAVNEKSAVTREASMIGNRGKFSDMSRDVYANLTSLVQGAGDTAESLKSFEGLLNKTANQFVKIVNGAQLDFPDVWQDSKFSRSYNLSFKFYSPYGDRASIMKFVYTPFLALLALALPRQNEAFSYVEPFLVRIFSPGFFNVDMGVITSMTINKGGADSLWTIDGLPQCIECTLDVQDLYPSLRQAMKPNMMKYNKNLTTYLENMAGIRLDTLSSVPAKAWLNRKLSNSILTTFDSVIENKYKGTIHEVVSSVNNLFR